HPRGSAGGRGPADDGKAQDQRPAGGGRCGPRARRPQHARPLACPGGVAMEEKLLARARRIRLAVFDVDGVLTDGGLLLGPGGAEFKTFHVHDGLGLVMLKEAGMAVAVISSRSSEVVAERMAALGIEYVYQGRH